MDGERFKDKRERRLNSLKQKESCQVKENNNLGNNRKMYIAKKENDEKFYFYCHVTPGHKRS